MNWEILPLVGISLGVILYFKYQTEVLNMIVPKRFVAFSDKEERFIARKLSGLLA